MAQAGAVSRSPRAKAQHQSGGKRHPSGNPGSRNLLRFGNPETGPKFAAILSVVETCRRLRIALRTHLLYMLPRLADANIRKLAARLLARR